VDVAPCPRNVTRYSSPSSRFLKVTMSVLPVRVLENRMLAASVPSDLIAVIVLPEPMSARAESVVGRRSWKSQV
jgi:hypothetical protein